MGILRGLLYNLRGLRMGLTTGRLLLWGLLRFALVLLVTAILGGIILAYHEKIMEFLWAKPGSVWLVWLWHLLSWMVSLFLTVLSALFAYLLSQVLFSVLIMEHMSKITEMKLRGHISGGPRVRLWRSLMHLIVQEIPRTIVPVLLAFLILVLGWLTPLGPIMTILSSAITILFLSWDNTDLVPARQMVPFRTRFNSLMKSLPFHLGFGLPFLVPLLNLLFLSFAPVGATLYWVEKEQQEKKAQGSS